MSAELSKSLRNILIVPGAFLLAACSGQATEQSTEPKVEIKKAVVEELFRTAYVGTADKRLCLWGKAYDTDLHIGENELVPSGFQPAIPRVSNTLTPDTNTDLFITPRGNDSLFIRLDVDYADGNVTFSTLKDYLTNDRLATLSCKQTVSVPYQP